MSLRAPAKADEAEECNSMKELIDTHDQPRRRQSMSKEFLDANRATTSADDSASSLPKRRRRTPLLSSSAEENNKFIQDQLRLRTELARLTNEKGLMDPDVALAYRNLAGSLEAEGRFDEAMELYQKELEIEKEVFGDGNNNNNSDHQSQMGTTHYNIGIILFRQGENEKAMQQYQKALKIFWKAHNGPAEHPSLTVGATYHAMGNVLKNQGKYKEVMQQYQKALEIFSKAHNNNGPAEEHEHEHPVETGMTYHAMGNVLDNQGKYKEAMQHYQKALAIKLKAHGPEHPSTGATYQGMGNVLFYNHNHHQGNYRYNEAMQQYQKAHSIFQKSLGPDHPWTRLASRRIQEIQSVKTTWRLSNLKQWVFGI